jgi:RHS repeat-associated protein
MKTKHKHWAVLTASTLGLSALASAANQGSEKYTYDGSGNIVEKSIDGQVTKMSFDASNKITSIASVDKGREQISYDAADRPVSYKSGSDESSRQLSYGYADKILQADNVTGDTKLFYNAEGQLVCKSMAGKQTAYAWDGNVMAAEGMETFVNEAHISGGVPVMAANRDTIVSDYLGNTLSHGKRQFTSTAYGEGLEGGRFTGKPFIKEIDSYIFHYRLYSPDANRWTNQDPIGFPDGANNFLYINGNPLSEVDPLGTTTGEATLDIVQPAPLTHSTKITFDYTYSKDQSPQYVSGSAKLPTGYDADTRWSSPEITSVTGGTATDVEGDTTRAYWSQAAASGKAIFKATPNAPPISYPGTSNFDSGSWEK